MRYPETASYIRSARRRKGLSQQRLAETIGCSRLQVIRWEQGLHRPEPEGLGARLADALGFSLDELLFRDGDDSEEEVSTPLARELASALQAEVSRQVSAQVAAQVRAALKETAA